MQPDSCDDHRYDDIIHLPHHVSAKHPHMPASDRAAQFAPFAALTGLGAAITETGRLTDEKTELDENEMMALNETLNAFAARLDEHPVAMFTYFQPDEKKSGGAYVQLPEPGHGQQGAYVRNGVIHKIKALQAGHSPDGADVRKLVAGKVKACYPGHAL